jgi:4-carboxymuconolactone decarboxylase
MTTDARQLGVETMTKLLGGMPPAGAIQPDFMDITLEHLFGTIWQRPGLSHPERSLFTVAIVAALGKEHETALHVMGALNQGVPREKLEELMIHLAYYAGWPAAVTGLRIVRDTAARVERGETAFGPAK